MYTTHIKYVLKFTLVLARGPCVFAEHSLERHIMLEDSNQSFLPAVSPMAYIMHPQHDSIRKLPKRLNIATIYTKYTLKLTYVRLNWRQSVAYEILSRLYVHPSLDRHNGLFLLMTEQGDGWQISYLWWLFIISTGFYSLSGVIYCTEQRKITPRNYGELKLFIARFWSHNCLCQRGSNTSYCKTFLRTILRK